MKTIDRAMLLEALGWTERQNWQGALRWSKAGDDLLSSESFVVEQDAASIKAQASREECDEDFNPTTHPLLAFEFAAREDGRMALSKLVENGVEQKVGLGSQERVLELAAQARRAIGGRFKAALVREMPSMAVKNSPGSRP